MKELENTFSESMLTNQENSKSKSESQNQVAE